MKYIGILLLTTVVLSCNPAPKSGELPFLGFPKVVDGKEQPYTVPEWTFVNQDSVAFSSNDLAEAVYVSDFFFTSCPSICPRVTREMKRVYDAFEGDPRVKFVSFTLDPKRDTPSRLKAYAAGLNVNTDQWIFLTGDKDSLYDLNPKFLQVAYEDASIPGGIDHTGKLILTDKQGRIRSFAEGTDPEDTPKLIADIKTLLKSYDAEP